MDNRDAIATLTRRSANPSYAWKPRYAHCNFFCDNLIFPLLNECVMLRAVSGFLLAPLLPPILIGAAIVLSDGTLEIVGDPFFLFVILYALLVSYAWALFLGLPAHLALRHFRRAKFWHYAFI